MFGHEEAGDAGYGEPDEPQDEVPDAIIRLVDACRAHILDLHSTTYGRGYTVKGDGANFDQAASWLAHEMLSVLERYEGEQAMERQVTPVYDEGHEHGVLAAAQAIRNRLLTAYAELETMALTARRGETRERLTYKAQGVQLAMSYVDEILHRTWPISAD